MNHTRNKINIVGLASCYGAQDLRCANGPQTLKQLNLKQQLEALKFDVRWDKNIYPEQLPIDKLSNTKIVLDTCTQLATQIQKTILDQQKFIVIGGDHSCAIGTWSGVKAGLKTKDEFGLIWIDAHMDSHTMASSPSKAIHGMPLASLMGYGDEEFCDVLIKGQKLKPHNLCLIGIRSYEPAEVELLEKLNVKIFYMSDIEKLGLEKVMELAKMHVCQHSQSYGISIDLDAIDPEDAPGVGSPAHNGINGRNLIECLNNMDLSDQFLGIEVAELNSDNDTDDKTAKLAIEIILACLR